MADLFDQLADHIVSGSQEKFVAELGAYFEGLLERGCRNPDEFAVLVAQSRSDAMAIWAKWDKRVTEETREAFEAALAEEDGAIVKAFRRAGLKPVRPDMTRRAADYYEQAARGMSEIMRRQNIAMTDLLEEEWYSVTSDAVTAIEGGAPYDEVMEQAVSRLSSRGLQTIDYRSGVSTAVDAAVRRHVVTQANQARNAILTARMDEYDMDLVYTSAHFGARPDHAEWQGKVFSRSGKSKKYPDLAAATGYGTVTGLCGANCRHRMYPYIEGLTKLPDREFAADQVAAGMSSDEYYFASQKQRGMERRIRNTKREIAAIEYVGGDPTAARLRLGRQQAKVRAFVAQNNLVREYRREKAYGIQGPESKTYAGPYARPYTRTTQQPRALKKVSEYQVPEKSVRIPMIGSFKKKRILGKRQTDLKEVNENFSLGTHAWTKNCQRCVVAYEMRRRGFKVRALPAIQGTDVVASNWQDYFNGSSFERCPTDNGLAEVTSKMKGWGHGARATVYVKWKGHQSAHVFCAENIKGRIVFMDPQSGVYDCSKYFRLADIGYTMIQRVDGFDLTYKAKGCFENAD